MPVADWFIPSAVKVTLTVEETTPERASVQFQFRVTALLFQPFAFAGVLPANVITGAVRSILVVIEAVLGRPAAFVAEHVRTVPDVSVVRLVVVHPVEDEIPDSGSVTLQLRDTAELFQPLTFGEGVTVGTITGAVVSNRVMTSGRLAIPSILTASNAAGFKPSMESTVGAICLVATFKGPLTDTGAQVGYDTNSGTWVSFSPKPPCSANVAGEGNGWGSKLTPSFMTTTISGEAGSTVGSGKGKPDPNDKMLVQNGWNRASAELVSVLTARVVSACTAAAVSGTPLEFCRGSQIRSLVFCVVLPTFGEVGEAVTGTPPADTMAAIAV